MTASGTPRRAPERAAIAFAAALLLAALVLRWWAERRIVAPWYQDEFRYAEAARAIAGDWSGLVRHFAALSYLYPRLIAPAWAGGSMATTYAVAKGIGVLLITSAAVPVFFWTRRVLPPWHSVLVVALTLALPTGLYAGALVTENAFFPAFVLAAFLLALMLERPTAVRQLLAALGVALVCAVRPQGIVLFVIAPTAVVLKAFFDGRETGERLTWRRLAAVVRPYLPLVGLLATGVVAYLVRQLVAGEAISGGLGLYSFVLRIGDYSVVEALKWTAYHFAGMTLAVGFLPFVALVLLVGEASRRRAGMAPAERALVAVAASATFWLTVQVGLYTSRWFPRMMERYLFHAEPLLLLALVVWINRGMPRPRGAGVVAAAAPVALILALPFERLIANAGILSDAFSLVALNRLAPHVGGTHTLWLILIAVAAASALLLLAPRNIVAVIAPTFVLTYLIASSLAVIGPIRAYAAGALAGARIDDPSWIDHAVGQRPRVDLVYAGDPEPERAQTIILFTQFWNRSVAGVDRLTPFLVCCVDSRAAPTDHATGRVRSGAPVQAADYVVPVPPNAEVAGTPIAHASSLTLVRPTRPLRVLSTTRGVYSDGWMGASASYDRFGPGVGRSRARVVVSREAWTGRDVPGRVRIDVRQLRGADAASMLGRVVVRRTWTVHAGSTRTFELGALRGPYRVAVHVTPTFSPSAFGIADARQLGAQVRFQTVAAR